MAANYGTSSFGQEQKNRITLKGSTAIVTEFFGYAVNSILYQRGLYPPEHFDRKKKYGLTMLVTNQPGLAQYVDKILHQLKGWLNEGNLQKLVLVISSVATQEVLERWAFDIEQELPDAQHGAVAAEKSEKEISTEISAIIRQITASVTFLPLLDEPCTFDLLVYTDTDSVVPSEWEESDPRMVANSAEVKLRSFSTKVHKVDASVAYKSDM